MTSQHRAVKYRLTTVSPLHIGTGMPRGLLDQPTFKIDGKPAVPGSSIKGRVRALFEEAVRRQVERRARCDDLPRRAREILEQALEELDRELNRGLVEMFRKVAPDPQLEPYAYYPLVCDPLSQLHCNPPSSALDFGDDRLETIRLVASYVLLRRSSQRQYCIACTYFGGNGHPSPLVFKPARAEGDVKTAVTTRVSIDRLTGAAKQERLFTVEYVPPGVVFEGEVALSEELSSYAEKKDVENFLQHALPPLLREVKAIGKHKSVGFGEVKVEVAGAQGGDLDAFVTHEVERRIEEACRADLNDLRRDLKKVEDEKIREKIDTVIEVINKYRWAMLRLI